MNTNEVAVSILGRAQQVIEHDVTSAEDRLNRLALIGQSWLTIRKALNTIEDATNPWAEPAELLGGRHGRSVR